MSHAQDFADALADIRADAEVSVTYVAGVREIELTDVGEGMKRWAYLDGDGLVVHLETKDFLIEAKQLGGIEPKVGHILKRRFGNTITQHRVESPNDEGCFYYEDNLHTAIRVHTIKSKETSA